jgi:hypothetical protein
MEWVRQQPVGTHVLADPGHGWRYGTSVRVSGGRDVLLEDVKDSAIAIYSRDVALRYLDRANAIGDFSQLTEHRARELARQYELDYLVTEADLALPVAYRNAQFRIYALREETERAEVTAHRALRPSRPSRHSNSVSIRCACTMPSHGDHANTVKRPSCDATSASASRWS